jgi:hypothetical protein
LFCHPNHCIGEAAPALSSKEPGDCRSSLTYAATIETGIFDPLAICSNALLIVSCVLRGEICRTRVAFDTVWQRLYLFSIINLARKIASERMDISCAFAAHQDCDSLISQVNCSVWIPFGGRTDRLNSTN